MPNYWIVVGSEENMRIAGARGFDIFGFKSTRRQPVRPQPDALQQVETAGGLRGAQAGADVRPEPLRVRQVVGFVFVAPTPTTWSPTHTPF